MTDCIFCKIVSGEVPAETVYKTKNTLAFLDINAVNKGDALVITKKHYPYFIETPDTELKELIAVARKVAEAVVKAVKPDGYNILINNKQAAGQVIMHVHAHIIPRFKGDRELSWDKKRVDNAELKKMGKEIVKFL